jgi:hypothetical protein
MSVAFAACQATVTLVIGFATSLLDPAVGQVGTGMMMLCSMLSSLALGSPVVGAVGAKGGLLLAMTCSIGFVMLFATAVFQHPGSGEQWTLYVFGAVLSGGGSGVLWTAQGTFFASTSALVGESEGISKEQATSDLSGRFATVLLAFEIASRFSASLLQGTFLHWELFEPLMSPGAMFLLFSFVAMTTVVVMRHFVIAHQKHRAPTHPA